ncbi:sensor domain-containing diguanylate cyclase [Bacillus suaedaesalsae]|uniref:Sensor domain-containing diguanylate cyclase n=1 Tax=Bacillus suaedaesalsae TaxID=2810349 RepID=A0ABS2DDE1_9BACI|nr:sensor domain-containing diguanylate cyclase [Bacillus suaedaesalsae]MBM6616476.1 sensor domain-containing diguanylate cyclase [Bacillus suaedaesalsae]
MGNVNLVKNKYQMILSIIDRLLKKIGSDGEIVTNDTEKMLDTLYENEHQDKEVVESVLTQLQHINEQIENMNWLNKHYKIIHDFSQTCSKTLNEDVLLEKAFELVSEVMPTDSFYIASYKEGDNFAEFLFMIDNGEYYPRAKIELGDNYTTKVIKTREIIHVKDSSEPQEFDVIIGVKETRSHLFVPIIIDDQVKGVISAQCFEDFAYRKEHEELLQLIGTQVFNSIETARLYGKIYYMSQTDELTGLKNHRAFHEDLSKLMAESDDDITLVMLDSDNLKKVNDLYGHDMGDKYLKVLADGISTIQNDEIEGYRYAGDEFMIIVKNSSTAQIEMLYERLITYYSENSIQLSNIQLNISISCGVAIFPEHGQSVDTLKKSADEALYEAKKRGKSRLVFS